jgi:indolepyruvate ferredoxin oxidoreductase
LIKRDFGPWIFTAFKWLAKFKGLRGGALDIFGKTEERRQERRMIEDYIGEVVNEILPKLSGANLAAAVALASVPDEIRGYGHVKEQSIEAAKALHNRHLTAFRFPQAERVAA